MTKSKTIMLRVSEEEHSSLMKLAKNKPLSTFIKQIVLHPDIQKDQEQSSVSNEWLELIKILENDFLDKLSVKSNSRDNVTKWAVYLLRLIDGDVTHETSSKETVPIFPYEGWHAVPDIYGKFDECVSEDGMFRYVTIESPQGKQVKVNDEEYWYEQVLERFFN